MFPLLKEEKSLVLRYLNYMFFFFSAENERLSKLYEELLRKLADKVLYWWIDVYFVHFSSIPKLIYMR